MFGYANHMRTLTQGRAGFSMEFEHYEAVPYAQAEDRWMPPWGPV
jgi:elongation factor G